MVSTGDTSDGTGSHSLLVPVQTSESQQCRLVFLDGCIRGDGGRLGDGLLVNGLGFPGIGALERLRLLHS